MSRGHTPILQMFTLSVHEAALLYLFRRMLPHHRDECLAAMRRCVAASQGLPRPGRPAPTDQVEDQRA